MAQGTVKTTIAPQSVWFMSRGDRVGMRRVFWGIFFLLAFFAIISTQATSGASIMAAAAIMFLSLIPAYLTATGRVQGIPIFPIYAISGIWLYAFPILMEHPDVVTYAAEDHAWAALAVCLHLLAGAVTWYIVARKPYKPPRRYYVLPKGKGDRLLLGIFAGAVFMSLAVQGHWFTRGGLFYIDPRIVNIAQRLIFALVNLIIFLFAYRLGRRELSKNKRNLFIACFVAIAIAATVSLYLYGLLSMTVLFVIGFTLGRRKIPWVLIFIVFPIASLLHYGKHEMRDKYWIEQNSYTVQPWQYPQWYQEWVGYGLQSMPWMIDEDDTEHSTILTRTSLMHLLLIVQDMSPEEVPYLYGRTYTIIPKLLIPRIIYPGRPSTLEGVKILSIHYELLNEESAEHTTIGWGLLNESFANFGFFGVIIVGGLFGWFYGMLSRMTYAAPLLSFRTLFAFIVLGMAILFEFSLSVYATSLFQTSVPLIMIRFFAMKPVRSQQLVLRRRQAPPQQEPPVIAGDAATT